MTTTMSKLVSIIGLGNILNIICIIFACGLAYGKINTTIDEFRSLRSADIIRIDKLEQSHEVLKDRVTNVEKSNIEVKVDLQYIKQGIEEIKRALNNKSSSSK
jgi:hypothetical protein